jgi:hypothetical protein
MTIPIQRSHNREHIPPLVRIPPLKKTLLGSAGCNLCLGLYRYYNNYYKRAIYHGRLCRHIISDLWTYLPPRV